MRKARIIGKTTSFRENAHNGGCSRHAIVEKLTAAKWFVVGGSWLPDREGGLNAQAAAARLNRLRKLAAERRSSWEAIVLALLPGNFPQSRESQSSCPFVFFVEFVVSGKKLEQRINTK